MVMAHFSINFAPMIWLPSHDLCIVKLSLSYNSRGTATNGRCCTVICVGISSLPESESHPALASKFLRLLYTVKLPNENYSCPAFCPHNLHLRMSNLPTLNTCNQTVTTLHHVSTNSQHVLYFTLAKHDHVATVVTGKNLLVKTASLLRLHCLSSV